MEENGRPHLEAIYDHWRPGAGKQKEDQFSDGTLRLIGLLWSLQEGDSLLLLEEPELIIEQRHSFAHSCSHLQIAKTKKEAGINYHTQFGSFK
jgi:hypothetical protein